MSEAVPKATIIKLTDQFFADMLCLKTLTQRYMDEKKPSLEARVAVSDYYMYLASERTSIFNREVCSVLRG